MVSNPSPEASLRASGVEAAVIRIAIPCVPPPRLEDSLRGLAGIATDSLISMVKIHRVIRLEHRVVGVAFHRAPARPGIPAQTRADPLVAADLAGGDVGG